jgi:hypothetical protein
VSCRIQLQREAEEEIACAERLARELDKRKGHYGLQDGSGGSEDEHLDGAPTRRHHAKFNSRCNADLDRLRHRSRSIREEFSRVEYQGEQVYHTSAHNALASRMLVDQITPHLPKDNEEVNAHVKRLQAMLDVAMVADPVYDQEDRDRGHDDDHRGFRGDSASITPWEECD